MQAAGKHPWEKDNRETQPLHLAAVLSSAVTCSFFLSPRSGGRIITLEGTGFELVQNVSMDVRGIGREQTVGFPAGCHPVTGSRAACPVPEDVRGVKLSLSPCCRLGSEQGWAGALGVLGF